MIVLHPSALYSIGSLTLQKVQFEKRNNGNSMEAS
jgi:hypothetical protein